MKKNIVINAIENSIVITKAFNKRASVFGSEEYKELHMAIQENPEMKIVIRNIEKKTYCGLTFEKMSEYIKTQPESEKMLIKFEAVQRVAKAKNSLYPLTKKWFLNAYPEYKENEVSANEAEKLTAELTAEAEEEVLALLPKVVA